MILTPRPLKLIGPNMFGQRTINPKLSISLKIFKNPGPTGPFGTENIQKTRTRGSVILRIKKNQVP
jgi:hypothetical protein